MATKIKAGIKKFEATIATAIATALGFTMALFWHDAIKAWIDEVLVTLPIPGTGYVYSVIAAIVVTIIASIGIFLVARWQK